ncbi:unnamed protein product [Ilex paraguariensis]|uniref:Ycf15 n=1 Tax=Ilex paraguariensis TaxID=185542 RepID=A0ABC8QUD0_9AQUA
MSVVCCNGIPKFIHLAINLGEDPYPKPLSPSSTNATSDAIHQRRRNLSRPDVAVF